MVSGIHIALSGLQSMTRRLGATGHNTANALSTGFKRQRVLSAEAAGGGVETTVETEAAPGLVVTDPATGETRELSNPNLAQDVIDLITSLRGAEANIQSLKAQDELIGSIIDIVA